MDSKRYAQVKSVFSEVCDLPVDARAAALDRLCGDDAELRREVDSLLKFHAPEDLVETQQWDRPQRDLQETSDYVPAMGRRLDNKTTGTHDVDQTLLTRSGLFRVRVRKAMLSLVSERGAVMRRWLLAALAVLGTAVVGWLLNATIANSLRESRAHELQVILDANVAAVRNHFASEKRRVTSWVQNARFRVLVDDLVNGLNPNDRDSAAQWRRHRARAEALEVIRSVAGEQAQFVICNRAMTVMLDSMSPQNEQATSAVAAESSPQDLVGQTATDKAAVMLLAASRGETVLRPPHRDQLFHGQPALSANDRPVITITVPIHAPPEKLGDITTTKYPVIALLVISGIGTEEGFNEIFERSRAEQSGETYAFSDSALMLPESRFDEQLRSLKLIPDAPHSTSVLAVEIRDPGGDLTAGFSLTEDITSKPRTRAALLAMSSGRGFDVEGYRDYRGVQTIGAWDWLTELGFGVITEMDFVEAYRPLKYLHYAFGAITGLLAICVGLLVISSNKLVSLKKQIEGNEQLGQYTLQRKIGEGGMGEVYLAKHARLIRPTAIKLLRPDALTQQTLKWFEREVQLASTLTHPNTIQIYDFGQTDEGIFYYAMEYLDGLTLEELARREGTLTPARTVFLLQQVCGSLHEAHEHGLIHRDIKPHNIMLCERGCQADVVKVLDFGLVKDLSTTKGKDNTATGAYAGTPMYMSPERLKDPRQVDARCDIYAVGAVAFRLLTGRDLFEGDSPFEIATLAARGNPPRPSEVAPQALPSELDALIHSCLAKSPDDRPASIAQFLLELNSIPLPDRWGQSDAQLWWRKYRK